MQERKTLTATLEEEKIQAKEKSTELLKQLESQHEEITQLRHRLSHTDDILRKELDAMHKRHQDAIDKVVEYLNSSIHVLISLFCLLQMKTSNCQIILHLQFNGHWNTLFVCPYLTLLFLNHLKNCVDLLNCTQG